MHNEVKGVTMLLGPMAVLIWDTLKGMCGMWVWLQVQP